MALVLRKNVKEHLTLLSTLSIEILENFCRLALAYINSGPNVKQYHIVSEKLGLTNKSVQNAVEALAYLLIQCCQYKVNEENFLKTVSEVNFTEEQIQLLTIMYSKKRIFISNILMEKSVCVSSYFRDLLWRFEANIGSRALLHQMEPIFTLNLQTSDSPTAGVGKTTNLLLQTDPRNLVHITNTLEKALQEIQSSHTRKVQRKCK